MFELISETGTVLSVILILMACIYLLVLAILIIRLTQQIAETRQKNFIERYEHIIFEYLGEEQRPVDVIKLFPVSNYKHLLNYLRGHLLSLKGNDWKKLARLVNETRLYDYLLKQLNSRLKKKIIFGAYFIGLAKSENAKFILKKNLKHKNRMVFLACALSLARINDVDSLNLILNRSAKFKNLSRDTLLSIIYEFKDSVCERLVKRLENEKSLFFESIIISALGYFKYSPAASHILPVLIKAESDELVLESLRYFREIEYLDASTAIRFCLLNSNPDIKVEAIRAAERIGVSVLEERIWSLIYDTERRVKITAAEAMYNFSDFSRKKLKQLAYSIPDTKESSIARMIVSEKTIHPD